MLEGTDDEVLARRLDDLLGDQPQFVDLQNALNLGEEALDQAEVTAGDARDRGYRLSVGEVVRRERQA